LYRLFQVRQLLSEPIGLLDDHLESLKALTIRFTTVTTV
jgi:hypothetical protein